MDSSYPSYPRYPEGPGNKFIYRRLFKAAERNIDELRAVIQTEQISLAGATNSVGQTVAHVAAKHNNVPVLRYVLEREPGLIDKLDFNKCTILHLAVVRGALNAVRYLVEVHDADICYLGGQYKDRTAVHVAIEFNHLDILKYFVEERGVDFNEPNRKQTVPPIFLTVKHRNWDMIEYLVEQKNADVRMLNSKEENILFSIVRDNFGSFLTYLLDEKKIEFNVNWRTIYGETLVHTAAILGRLKILEYLVDEKNATLNAQKVTDKRTPLHLAASRDDYEVCKFLIERGANPLLEDKYGEIAADKARDQELYDYLKAAAAKGRRPRSIASPYSSLQPSSVIPLTLQFEPRQSISHTSDSVDHVESETKSLFANHTGLPCFQSFLFLAQSMMRVVRGGRSFQSSASIIQSKMSSIAIDAIDRKMDFRKL